MVGKRREYAAQVRELVERAGDTVRAGLAGEETVREYVEAIKAGVRARSRTEMRLYAEVMKLLGEERKLVVEFVHSLGASGESELRRIVEAYKSAGEADTLTAIERMTTALEAMLPMHEEHRGMVIRRLGGYLPVSAYEPMDGEHNHGA